MNKMILMTNEIIVVRYLFLWRLMFLKAISPSMSNNFVTNLFVFIFLPFILISLLNLIASIGVTSLARTAGKRADKKIDIIIKINDININVGCIAKTNGSVIISCNILLKISRITITFKTLKIKLMGIANALIILASKKTDFNICIGVAPTLDNIPSCFFLSVTDIAKEL